MLERRTTIVKNASVLEPRKKHCIREGELIITIDEFEGGYYRISWDTGLDGFGAYGSILDMQKSLGLGTRELVHVVTGTKFEDQVHKAGTLEEAQIEYGLPDFLNQPQLRLFGIEIDDPNGALFYHDKIDGNRLGVISRKIGVDLLVEAIARTTPHLLSIGEIRLKRELKPHLNDIYAGR